MKKIYIAGPDVFERQSVEIGKKNVEICKKYGYIGLYPLDNEVDFNQPKHSIALDIFKANTKMIQECDIVVANLNPFRGKESDSGTVWECGYAYGLGKKVYGYMEKTHDYVDSFTDKEKKEQNGVFFDNEGRIIEDFEHPLNLMIACSVEKIFQGDFETALKGISALA